MLALLTNLAPLILGYFAKFFALKAKDSKELQKMQLIALNAQAAQYTEAREYETPSAGYARRFFMIALLSMVGVFILGYAAFGVPIFVEQVTAGQSYLLGLIQTPAVTEWVQINGIPAFDEIFRWMAIMIEFYFGGQLAKRI